MSLASNVSDEKLKLLNNMHHTKHMSAEEHEALHDIKKLIEENKVIEYTSRWKNFQFRSPVYLDGHFEPNRFDLVKWEQHEPYEVTNGITGEKEISTENCYTVATLVWNSKEGYFNFESCGLRYLVDSIDGLNEWVRAFACMKAVELKHEDD